MNKINAADQECKRKVLTKARLEITKNKGWERK